MSKKRPSTQIDYKRVLRKDVRPILGAKKVADIEFADIDRLHRRITKRGSPYEANRARAVLSKMFNLAIKWKMRADNPVKGVERNDEEKRAHYLDPEKELPRLASALAEHDDKQASDIIRLLLLTGARRGEVQAMRWDQLDLDRASWTKPSAHTKQKKTHHAVLSDAAVHLLRGLRADAEEVAKAKGAEVSEWVFPSDGETGHRVEIKKNWAAVCKAAGITRTVMEKDSTGRMRAVIKHAARIHDLRHSYASILASAGLSLPIIGALLGHTQPATTARYAHLFNDPLRKAAEQAAAVITGKPSAKIVDLGKRA